MTFDFRSEGLVERGEEENEGRNIQSKEYVQRSCGGRNQGRSVNEVKTQRMRLCVTG